MGQLPKEFPPTPTNSIINFNFTDFADGTGIVVFLGGGLFNDGVETFRLDTNVFNPWHTEHILNQAGDTGRFQLATTASTTFVKLMDFDMLTSVINASRTIQGTFMVNVPICAAVTNSGTANHIYCIAKLIRLRSAAETVIATAQSEPANFKAGTNSTDAMLSATAACTTTSFKKGDQIQITLEIWMKISGTAATSGVGLMTDPLARDFTQINVSGTADERLEYDGGQQLQYAVPFRNDF